MTALKDDIAAFDAMRGGLEADHLGEWVVIRGGALIATYKSFEDAATEAVERFDSGPYLIRQIGAPPVQLPGGMIFRPAHASGPGWL